MIISENMVEKWAEYSGDWNPVHFDPDAAAELGIEGKFAHGMLVLLHLKPRFLEHALDLGVTTSFIADFRFRAPVRLGTSVLERYSGTKRLAELAIDDKTGTSLITANLYSEPSPRWLKAADDVERLEFASLSGDLPPGSSNDTMLWVAVEAQAFKFMVASLGSGPRIGIGDGLFERLLPPDEHRWLLIHTRHESFVSASIARRMINEKAAFFDVEPKVNGYWHSHPTGVNKIYICVVVVVCRGDEVVLASRLHLSLIKSVKTVGPRVGT